MARAAAAATMPSAPPQIPAKMKIGMKMPRSARWLPAAPAVGEPLVHPAVDLLLDPVEEPRHELLVMARAELLPGGESGVELLLRLDIHARTMA